MDLKSEISNLSFEEYTDFLMKVPEENMEECFNIMVSFLSDLDIERMKKMLIVDLIVNLSPKLKIKYYRQYNFEYLDYYNDKNFFKLFEGVNDENYIQELIKNGINSCNNYNEYIKLYNQVPYKYKKKYIIELSNRENEINANIIDIKSLDDYLLIFNDNDRLDVLENIIFKYFEYNKKENHRNNIYLSNKDAKYLFDEGEFRFNMLSLEYILNLFINTNNVSLKDSTIYHVFNLMIEKGYINKEFGYIYTTFYKVAIVCNIDIKEVIDFAYGNQKLSSLFLLNELDKNKYEEALGYTLAKYDYLFEDFSFFGLINRLDNEKRREYYINYCINNDRFDYLYPIINGYIDPNFYIDIILNDNKENNIKVVYRKIFDSFVMNANEENYKYDYSIYTKIFSELFSVDYDKLNKYVNSFGVGIYKYLENENYRNIINMDDILSDRLIRLFNKDNLYFDDSVKNDILNSLLQRKFIRENPEIYGIFHTIEESILNNDNERVSLILNKIRRVIINDSDLFKDDNYINDIVNKIINGDSNLLHELTSYYILKEREKYVQIHLNNIDEELELYKVISRESYKEVMLDEYTLFRTYAYDIGLDKFDEEQKYVLKNKELLEELVRYKKDPKGYNLDNNYKKYLKPLSGILDIFYNNDVNLELFNNPDLYNYDNEKLNKSKYLLKQKKVNNYHIINCLTELNYNGLINVLSDEELYNKLNEYLKKYKMLGWMDTFSNLIRDCDIDFNNATIGAFISNFDKISHKINNSTLTSVIDISNAFVTTSNVYYYLFGKEDYDYIITNSGRNRAPIIKSKRLESNSKLIKDMYERTNITIPSMNKNYMLSNNKVLNVNIGNVTSMMNFTYGKRTDSCLRKGGAFNDLFEYAIKNKNGFHVRISDSDGNLVSRVTGIRNGNTVYLNELRSSLEKKNYSDEDLYELMKMVSKDLIELSKNSSYPIDNVIITSDYALSSHSREKEYLDISKEERNELLRNLSFNIKTDALILASSNENNKLVKFTNSDELPEYDLIRDEVKVYNNEDAVRRMKQLHFINDIINGVKSNEIDISTNFEIPNYIVSDEDFYVAYYNDRVETYIIDIRKNNSKTLDEINYVLNNNEEKSYESKR